MTTRLEKNLADSISLALGYSPPARALVIFDLQSPLSQRLTESYRRALPDARFVDFGERTHAEVLAEIDTLAPGDLAVMIESTRFDLREFRFRLELFRRKLAVIEHPHLARMNGPEMETYVDSLAYDPGYYRPLGHELKRRLDQARSVRILGEGNELHYTGPFETAKLNVGDYAGFTNIGGQFPIGEVFTEPCDLRSVRGEALIFAFGDSSFAVNVPETPIVLEIEQGEVTGAPGASADFLEILDTIRAGEEKIRIRELGLGLNPAMTRERRVADVGTYERMCGVHLSLGAKHAVYPKAGFNRQNARFHIDVFAVADRVEIDGTAVFENGRYFDPRSCDET